MTYTATITSKRQLTLPVAVFEAMKLQSGQKLTVELFDDHIRLQSIKQVLGNLRGSVKIPSHMKHIDLDLAIRKGKEKYFAEK